MPEFGRDEGGVSFIRVLVEVDDGGVFGLEDEEPDRFLIACQSIARRPAIRRLAHNESNLSMSACEYAAPLTRLESRPDLLDALSRCGGFQKGEVELRAVSDVQENAEAPSRTWIGLIMDGGLC